MGQQNSSDFMDYKQSNDRIVRVLGDFLCISKDMQKVGPNRVGYGMDMTSLVKKNKKAKKKQEQEQSWTLLTIQDLKLNQTHQGCAIRGIIFLQCIEMVSIMFTLLDETGNIEKVAVYNYPLKNKSASKVFCMGASVTIKDPYYKMAMDGSPIIRIDDPSKITIDKVSSQETYKIEIDSLINISKYLSDQQNMKQLAQLLLQEGMNFAKEEDKYIFKEKIEQLGKNQENEKSNETKKNQKKNEFSFEEYFRNSQSDHKNYIKELQQFDDYNQIIEFQEMGPELLQQFQLANIVSNTPEYQQAIIMFQEILQRNPNLAVVNFNLGEIAFRNGYWELAINTCLKFIQIHEKKKFTNSMLYQFAFYYIGRSYDILGNFRDAIYYHKKAVSLHPDYQTFLIGIGQHYLDSQQFKQAQEQFDRVIDIYKKQTKITEDVIVETSRAYLYKGVICRVLKDINGIITNYQSAIVVDPLIEQYILQEIKNLMFNENFSFNEKSQVIDLVEKIPEFEELSYDLIQILFVFSPNKQEQEYCLQKMALQQESLIDTSISYDPIKQIENVKPEFSMESTTIQENNIHVYSQQDKIIIEECIYQNLAGDTPLPPNLSKEQKKDFIKKKYNKLNINFDQSRQRTKDKQTQYKGYLGSFQHFSIKYICCLDSSINVENNLKRKFSYAADNGFVMSNLNSAGLKLIKINNKLTYILKIMSSGYRLICPKEQKQNDIIFLLFNKLENHKKSDKLYQK